MDPITVVETLVSVAEAWNKYQEKRNFVDWQDSVSNKLDELLQYTQEILQSLKSLRVEIEANMDARFRLYYLAELRAAISDVGDVLAGIDKNTNAEQRERLVRISDELKNVIKQSLAYGFGVVPAALVGYLTLMPVLAVAGIPAEEVKATRASLQDLVFEPALDAARKGSFAWALQESNTSKDALKAMLVEALRPATLGMWAEFLGWTGAAGGFQGASLRLISATCTFSGNWYDVNSITATELISAPVADFSATSFPDPWANAAPAPAIGVSAQTNTWVGAANNRLAMLEKYNQATRDIETENKSQRVLGAFIELIEKETGATQGKSIV